MKKPHILLITFIILFTSFSFSQSGAAKSLEIGNKWVNRYESGPTDYTIDTLQVEIVRDTLISGKVYAVLNSQFQRADSVSIFEYNIYSDVEYEIIDFSTTNDSIFIYGQYRKRVIRRMDIPTMAYFYYEYVEGIGLIKSVDYDKTNGQSKTKILLACRIDGVEYGETHLLDVEDNTITTTNFILTQNFPNPFNPTTQISYELPQNSDVELIIYNSLGEEVNTLVNNSQSVGRYTINWNGLNSKGEQVPGGIYFYTLKTNDFTQTKKMLLLR